MDVTVVVVAMAALFAWGLLSNRLERADLTAPIVFIAVGVALAGFDLVHGTSGLEAVTPLVEVTLVWVLFSDAARLPVQQLRRDKGRYLRLLAVGLPLTILSRMAAGGLALPRARHLAGAVRRSRARPHRRRPRHAGRDQPGRALPDPSAHHRRERPQRRHRHARGDAGHRRRGRRRRPGARPGRRCTPPSSCSSELRSAPPSAAWAARHCAGPAGTEPPRSSFAGIAVLALALLSYACALALHGNGFVAAFCGGLAFGAFAGRRAPAELEFLEQMGTLLASLVWMAFGAIAIPITVDRIDANTVLYAVLSLTVVRMVPVALASIGAGLDRTTILFVGWFGPRGLASLVFALLALEALGSHADEAVAILTTTVLLSVVAHGLTAAPLARRYGRFAAATGPEPRGTATDPPSQTPA